MRIISDFKDYYDEYFNENASMTYERVRKGLGRGRELKILKALGIKTIEVKAVSEFDISNSHLVVYTNPLKHDYQGKKIVEYGEAQIMYDNHLASKFIEEANGITFKYLQIGTRRFRVYMKNDVPLELKRGRVIEIQEIQSVGYRQFKSNPIFSIDYINIGGEMVAIDFNEVQNLGELGLEEVMDAKAVTEEVIKVSR